MSCPYESQIADYLEGTLGGPEAGRVDAHLAGCESCSSLVADLRAIRATARVLERHAPPPEVWNRVAAQIAADGRGVRSHAWPTFRGFAAAAMIVLMLGAGAWFAWERQGEPAAATAANAAPPASASAEPSARRTDSVDAQLQQAEQQYADTIQGLDAIRQAGSTALDPDTAAVLQANLTVIDKAIGESRAALQSEPSSSLAQDSLFGALQSKVSLLQDTVALINEMRKGNPEGTARIVSGMNQ